MVAIVQGRYPTPVERLDSLSTPLTQLWIKRDDLTHPLYGGNKVRKLEHLLRDAREKGKKRIVTVGAAGSHHVLATTIFGVRAGFEVEAMLVPQRRTEHVEQSIRADLSQGLVVHPARTFVGAAIGLAARSGRDVYLIPMGGSTVVGTMGYVDAARELKHQIEEGALPEPDVAVVAVGSGGTAAGLAAGFAALGMKTRILGVLVATPIVAVRWLTLRLMKQCYPLASGKNGADLDGRIAFTAAYLGDGYGEPTERGVGAMEQALGIGIALDSTYTAKTFAAAMDAVHDGGHRNVLYWHTLSSAPLEPLIRPEIEIPPRLASLLK